MISVATDARMIATHIDELRGMIAEFGGRCPLAGPNLRTWKNNLSSMQRSFERLGETNGVTMLPAELPTPANSVD
jgi:hypothetical protein